MKTEDQITDPGALSAVVGKSVAADVAEVMIMFGPGRETRYDSCRELTAAVARLRLKLMSELELCNGK